MQSNLSEEIMQLSVSERIQLAEDIWDSVVTNQQSVDLTNIQEIVLRERLEDYAADPEGGDTWDKVRKRIWQSL